MALLPEVSDEALTRVLSTFAGSTAVVLKDPERWLGWGRTEDDAALPRRAASAAGRVLLGRTAPGAQDWAAQDPADRAEWWVDRISNLAGFLAATPRLAGAVADRFPLQAALGASVQGLGVCATAKEYGVRDPDDWVPLLGQVLFDRKLSRGDTAAAPTVTDEPDDSEAAPGPLRRARSTVWRLAKTFLAVQGMFDERPRGSWASRALGKVPVVGLLGGWLDERGGVRKASTRTAKLVVAGAGRRS
jgi:hypothetical protein